MDLGLDERVVIVTGASAGIGRASAEILVQEGACVVAVARSVDKLEALAATLRSAGGEVATVAADVADESSSERIRDAALEAFGRIDGVINAAGVSSGEHLRAFSDESWAEAYRVNTLSAVRLSLVCIPTMQGAGWGRIITIASTAGRDPDPRFASYGAAKAALMHATRAISRSYAKYGITANCVLPGLTRSESVLSGYASAAEHMGVSVEDVEKRMLQLQPIAMGRTGAPEEVAKTVVFLCSEASSWTTGVAIAVDGGTIRDLP
ncbi:SDR family oxidoreductase [Microbacterium sp. zg.Y625]|uniref:SDR family NAD(P)-dependent oxidoreductase n=1 Tax=Microbacterium jiangjiandongii TaxID=3049071 RepID=UPI00214B309A|nr:MULTISPECIES: SDR family NAD(P)-dependent oxidoreductase [unclassified Microbacterium]MCR2793475.1 SDR family oxidoreductase [Microbacterium sp. zg.Y625]MCR2815347.1 SDR family oxidoreductase [Microbacterium sp. zg.Y843]WIM25156.1 SDR family oxidoreductase [Microbacterium sp. zg-Y625]